jgi:glycine hydroxymethyltransferase
VLDVGGPHNHTTAAIAVALGEALEPQFADYARRTVANAKALADGLLERGFDLVSGGTDNHLILVDLTNKGVPGKPAAQALDRARITANYNTVPFDPREPFDPSGIRIGTPAATTRGMGENEMERIASWIDDGIDAARREDEATIERIAEDVRELALSFPIPGAVV